MTNNKPDVLRLLDLYIDVDFTDKEIDADLERWGLSTHSLENILINIQNKASLKQLEQANIERKQKGVTDETLFSKLDKTMLLEEIRKFCNPDEVAVAFRDLDTTDEEHLRNVLKDLHTIKNDSR